MGARARRFLQAVEQGDLSGLEALLAHDVELTADGGGKVPALARTLRGRSRVARTLIDWARGPAWAPAFRGGRCAPWRSTGLFIIQGVAAA
ncbi:MAG TPA: hypothetical protein VII16_14130 [Actinomycetes bacterium]